MRDRNIGCLPVNDSDGFIGMLTEKDLTTRATAEGLNPTTTTVRQIMTSGITYCQETDRVEDALRTMEDKHIHHLPVRLSGSNKVVGIVSLSDLALKGPQELYSNVSRLAFQSASLSRALLRCRRYTEPLCAPAVGQPPCRGSRRPRRDATADARSNARFPLARFVQPTTTLRDRC